MNTAASHALPAAEPGAVTTVVDGPVCTITLHRPQRRNAVDGPTALALRQAFEAFEADDGLRVAVFTGGGGQFCAGADLTVLNDPARRNTMHEDGSGPGPMGPTRLDFTKPVIAAVEGHAVAGGLELALMCDLRVAARSAVFGVFCRRWGVPLIDGGTVRLPRLIGQSHALDMILTGRPVLAPEALTMGLANRVVPKGEARAHAEELAATIASFPVACMRNDRLSLHEQHDLPIAEALQNELRHGLRSLEAGDALALAAAFSEGQLGRHGSFEVPPSPRKGSS